MQLACKNNSTQRLLQETASMKDNKSSDFHENFSEALDSANLLPSTLNNTKLKSFQIKLLSEDKTYNLCLCTGSNFSLEIR